jgi:hypothetical protein
MRQPKTFKALEELGRVRLSKSFFMREFLYSEISQVEGIPNIPDEPELAIAAGKNQTIILEDLNVSGMVKNRRLARVISPQGWREFRNMC